MSLRLQEQVMDSPAVPNKLKFVLRAIAKFASDDGTGAYASQSKYAKYACKARTTVNEHIRELLQLGFIRDTGKKQNRCCVYAIEVSKLAVCSVPLSGQDDSTHEQRSVPHVGQDSVPLSGQDHVPTVGHKPVIEPVLEPEKKKEGVVYTSIRAGDEPATPPPDDLFSEPIPAHFQNGLGGNGQPRPNRYRPKTTQDAIEAVQEHPLFQAFEDALGNKQYVDPTKAQQCYEQACQMVLQGITAEEVKAAVSAKKQAGKTLFRFEWVGEWVSDWRNGQRTQLTRLIPVDENGNEIDMRQPEPAPDAELIRVDLAADFAELAAEKVVNF